MESPETHDRALGEGLTAEAAALEAGPADTLTDDRNADRTEGLEEEREIDRLRRAAWIVCAVAALAVIVAILVNWLALDRQRVAESTGDGARDVATQYDPSLAPAEAPPDLLPVSIIGYETITHQEVPGQAGRAVEAIFVTLSMDLEIARPMNSYARAEAFSSDEDAKRRLQELMRPYDTSQSTLLLGGATPAAAGFTPDLGAYAIAWTKESAVVFVKTSFREIPPVRRQEELLTGHGDPVAEALETFQRTGQQGLQLDGGG